MDVRDDGRLILRIERYEVGRKEEMMNQALDAYEESTGNVPDTRDYVALEDAVSRQVEEEEK